MTTSPYQLLDSGQGRKLERFGKVEVIRPASQAVWMPQRPAQWERASAAFARDPDNCWEGRSHLPESWEIELEGIRFLLKATDFGHLGIFPEQQSQWRWIRQQVRQAGRPVNVLNLFAYSGGSTLAAALEGAEVCHLDASKGMVAWAKENAALNNLDNAPVRWIVDDALKFMRREVKRGRRYDAVILDPPTFGRGAKGEVFKIEEAMLPLLDTAKELLSDHPLFLLLSSHTPGYTPTVLHHLLRDRFGEGKIEVGEMFLEGEDAWQLPSGAYGRWRP